MRPIPESRHLVAVIIFAAVAAAAGYFASLDDEVSDSQLNIASAAVKRHDPGSFPHDPIFGDRQLWRFHTPAFQGLMELVLVPTDYQDLLLPFRALAGIVVMIYLCGMYALLYSQCRSWSVAAFVAVLSTRAIDLLGGAMWGVGPLDTITPPGLCLAVTPLVLMAFLHYSQPSPQEGISAHWRLLLVFGVVGLMGNFHLVTAMNLTIVLLVAYVARQRFSPRCLPMAIGCGLAALVAALPYAWYYFSLRASLSRGDGEPALAAVREALQIGQLAVLYPGMLKALLDWRLLVGALVLAVPAAAVLGRVERFRAENLSVWAALAAASLFTALGLHGASQLVGWAMRSAPPIIDFPQASSLLMPPLYVLLAQALTSLFRLLRTHRVLVRWGCAVLLGAWLIPADNARIARHMVANLATAFMDEADKPAYVLRYKEHEARARELEAIARWAAPRDGALYVTDRPEFRVLARRPIVAGPNDARYLYYLTPGRLDWWVRRFQAQEQLLHPSTGRADAEAIAQFVADLLAKDPTLKPVAEWYVILRTGVAPETPGPLQLVEGPGWGQHYRLYRVR